MNPPNMPPGFMPPPGAAPSFPAPVPQMPGYAPPQATPGYPAPPHPQAAQVPAGMFGGQAQGNQGPPIDPLAFFAGIGQAEAVEGGNYIRPGRYVMRVNALKTRRSTKPGGFDSFINEMLVVKVLSATEAQLVGKTPHGPGEQVADVVSKKFPATFLGNVKSRLAVLSGSTSKELEVQLLQARRTFEEFAAQAVGPSQPFSGRFLEVFAREQPTQPKLAMVNGQATYQTGVFTVIKYVRMIPARHVAELLTAEEQTMLFPNGELATQIQIEDQVAGRVGQPAPAPAAAPVASTLAPAAQVQPAAPAAPPAGLQFDPRYPGYAWDGSQWISYPSYTGQ